MKKTYIIPNTDIIRLCHADALLQEPSLSGGDTLGKGGDTFTFGVTDSDVKRNTYNVWDDDWSKN